MSALTDPPAVVYPFVPMAPDRPRMTADDFRAALEYYDAAPLPTVAWFAYPPDPAAVDDGRGLITHFAVPAAGKTKVRFALSVGAAPAGYQDQFVSVWFFDGAAGAFYQAAVKAGATFVHSFTANVSSALVVWLQLGRVSSTSVIAPLHVWLGMATRAIPEDDGSGTPNDSTGL